MRLAIMQPYVFPYAGYFQLIASADRFVVYDDVAYMKHGWINRNRILVQGKDHLFTIPLKDASPNKLIRETSLHPQLYQTWKEKFYKTLEAAYKRAPHFGVAFELINGVLNSSVSNVSELARTSLKTVCDYAGITTEFVSTATVYKNDHLRSAERVIDICKKEGASMYINAIGGKALYKKETFAEEGLELKFLSAKLHPYTQHKNDFLPGLSVIDLLMFNSQAELKQMFSDYSLID